MESRANLVGDVMCGWNAYAELGYQVIERAEGPYIYDRDGKRYIDWNMGWGSLLLGHTPPEIDAAMREALEAGFGYQYESESTAKLAAKICDFTGADKVRFATTGTGSTMFACRVARQATGRRKMLKFEGHFHGMNESLYWGCDSGQPFRPLRDDGSVDPLPASAGLLAESPDDYLIVLPFNDPEALEAAFREHGEAIAGVILEPISLNVGCIRPDDGFLQLLRDLCTKHGSALIFDEMRTGFRVARGGAAELYGVEPDLRTYGKALGGGMPIAALAGKAAFMDQLGPLGKVGMGGTNNGRNFVVRGALAALEAMDQPGFYDQLGEANEYFVAGLRRVLDERKVPGYVEGYGGTIGLYLGTDERPRTHRDVRAGYDREYHGKVLQQTTEKGLFAFTLLLGSCPEVVVLSREHTREVMDETLSIFDDVLKANPYPAKG